jgi:hypothetical protein
MIRNAWNYLEDKDFEWQGTCSKSSWRTQARLIENIPPWNKVVLMPRKDIDDLIEIYTVEKYNWN